MGLGKTIQVARFLHAARRAESTVLLVVPLPFHRGRLGEGPGRVGSTARVVVSNQSYHLRTLARSLPLAEVGGSRLFTRLLFQQEASRENCVGSRPRDRSVQGRSVRYNPGYRSRYRTKPRHRKSGGRERRSLGTLWSWAKRTQSGATTAN